MHEYPGHLHGFLMFGDAVCGFNPSYGQGVTASALAARCLARALARHDGPIDRLFLRRYYQRQAVFLRDGWALSTLSDFLWPKTEGKRPAFLSAIHRTMRLLEEVTHADPVLLKAVWPLSDFGARPWSVLTPEIARRFASGLSRRMLARPLLEPEIDLFASHPPVTEKMKFAPAGLNFRG
jgi:2-polyprenyl-6-methoxyphenol hydroxylase-like FAD-dependent oxidoreductase